MILLSQGAAAGIFIAFLFVVAQIAFVRNPYNFLFIGVLPLVMLYGLLVGTFKSFIIWICSKLFRRRLWVIFRVAMTLPMFGLLIGVWWWQWFSKTPLRSEYYSGLSPSAVASLEGVKVIRLGVNLSASYAGTERQELTVPQLKSLIIHKLMDVGIDAVEINSPTPAQATLYVDYSFIQHRKQPDFYNSGCRLRLTQDVVLHRDPHLRTEASTWEYQSSSLSAGGEKHSLLTEAVDQFVRDYNRANSNTPDASSYSEERSGMFRLIWQSALLLISATIMGLVIGSSLRPWRAFAYGVGRHSSKSTISAVITGILLRLFVVFLFMESIVLGICILQSNSQKQDIYFALLTIGHCTLGAIAAFSRFKFVTLAPLSLIAISPVLLLFTYQPSMHWIVRCLLIVYIILWMAFLFTRSSVAQLAFSNIKQELRYYLID